jgi:hypothetical protein
MYSTTRKNKMNVKPRIFKKNFFLKSDTALIVKTYS